MEYSLYHKLSQIALHERKAELVLRNAMIADVFTDEIRRADIAVADGYIAAVGGSYEGTEEIDLNGKYVLPGFMDAHLHLESTMVTPNELITAAALCGTTTFIVDPHEAANVSGTEGIDYILDQTEHSPANVFVMMPSCVPATEYDDNGCLLTAEKMAPYLSSPRILGLGEVMNAPGVIHGDRQLHKKLELFSGRILDGHAPYLPDDELTAYALAGIRTDHEASDFDYALEEIRRGIHVHIREGSAAHNLETLINGILAHDLPCENFSFCTDDKHIEDILRQGHINYNVRRAVELGLSPMAAIKMATINTARCYGLKELGAVAPGYQADLIVTDDLSSFRILSVYHKGQLIDPSVRPETAACPDSLKNTVHVRPLSSDAFRLSITKEEVPVIRLNASQITTSKIACHLPKTDNYLPQDGFNKIAAVERHKATGKTGVGICTGYNIRNGAIASSVSHDSHNIIVIGDNDADMLLAVSEIIRVQGGYPLPVMGLMSDAGFETVNRTLGQMIAEAHRLGIPDEVEPFITLSFLALPVIPEIRITPRGVLDTVSFEFLSY